MNDVVLRAFSHISSKEEKPTIYFQLKGTHFRKLLESLSSIPRELHDCGAINCELRIGGFINIDTEKPEFRDYRFALFFIQHDDEKVLETDYDRFGKCLRRKQS